MISLNLLAMVFRKSCGQAKKLLEEMAQLTALKRKCRYKHISKEQLSIMCFIRS